MKKSQSSRDMGAYWDKAIIEWEQTSYAESPESMTPEKAGWIEQLAGRLRRHIRERQKTCLRALQPHVEGKVCLEIGSATGSSCFALLEMGTKRVIGFDISPRAIRIARAEAASRGFDESRAAFYRYAAGEELPIGEPIDIVFGLGIAEYIEPEVFRDFVAQVNPKSFFFSYDERRINVQKAMHFIYRNIKGIPYYKMYSAAEIVKRLDGIVAGPLRTFREAQNAFVTDLPDANRAS